MSKIRTLIVDDEPEAREGLNALLQDVEAMEVVSVCSNGLEAIDVLKSMKIDLLFLDIQMPLVDGFDVIRSVPQDQIPMIIFITAYDAYTLKAFEVNALDYLLKPFSNLRFREACERAIETFQLRNPSLEAQKASKWVSQVHGETGLIDPDREQKLIFKENGQVIFLDHHELIWIEAFDYYVKMHTETKFFLARISMKKLEQQFQNTSFIRIHKSSIINKDHISNIKIRDGHMYVVLSKSIELKVSRTYKPLLKDIL